MNTPKSISVTSTFEINIKGQIIQLTREEAESLYHNLGETLNIPTKFPFPINKEYFNDRPYYPPPLEPFNPPYPSSPQVWCGNLVHCENLNKKKI